ncbi:MAG: hypothetical protein ACI97B_001995 [Verrucomicrobiales bacterium]|jgi:uncharacterized protein (TIGR02757 family)
MALDKDRLEALYARMNVRSYASPDPIEVIYRYAEPVDQEVIGLVAASLAYGRVASILTNIQKVADVLGDHPAAYLAACKPATLRRQLSGFQHRWTREEEMVGLLLGIRKVLRNYDSLGACFLAGYDADDETILPALSTWTDALARETCPSLLAQPASGSACKRLLMYLRWMVRKDAIDLGLWSDVSPAKLLVPLDTHMFNICTRLRLTKRKQANLKTAIEVSQGFARIAPEDPVRYDFALTRLGIRSDESIDDFFQARRG